MTIYCKCPLFSPTLPITQIPLIIWNKNLFQSQASQLLVFKWDRVAKGTEQTEMTQIQAESRTFSAKIWFKDHKILTIFFFFLVSSSIYILYFSEYFFLWFNVWMNSSRIQESLTFTPNERTALRACIHICSTPATVHYIAYSFNQTIWSW